MPELLHPGVYVEEIPSAVRPIEGVSTSTAAFVGVADKGPIPGATLPTGRPGQPIMVTSFTDYSRQFGGYRQDSFLTYAVRSFFDNGGRRLYVVRIVGSGAATSGLGASASLTLNAASPGTWSGALIPIVDDASNGDAASFNLTVAAPGQGATVPIETFTNLTVSNAQTTVNAGSKLVQLPAALAARPANSLGLALTTPGTDSGTAKAATVTTPGANGIVVDAKAPGAWANAANAHLTVSIGPATNGQASSFDLIVKLKGQVVERFPNVTFGGGSPPPNYARTVVNARSQYTTLPNDFTVRPDNTPGDVDLTGGADGAGGTPATWGPGSALAIQAANPGAWGDQIGVAIAPSSDRDANNFKVIVSYGGTAVETFDRVTYAGSPTLSAAASNPAEYLRSVINSRSQYIAITADLNGLPPLSPTSLNGQPIPVSLASGSDGAAVAAGDYTGQPAVTNLVTGTGLHALDKVTDVNLIAIPGQGDPQVVNAGMEYCKNRQLQDCFFIADVGTIDAVSDARRDDAAPDVSLLSDVRDFATSGFGGTPIDKSAGDYGAVYYPWVWAADPIGVGRNPRILLPPSGFLTGLYARIDNSRGVFKAPAGTEAGLFGALSPANDVSDAEQDELNPVSVNVIRTVPGSGIVSWGARTIGSDASWRYIPVRRMAIFLRVSIYNGIQWAVFEPNDEPLWASLRLNIRAFMLTQFRAGAFQGSTPDAAFFVKCDSSTTTQQDIDNGVVNILVGFAPLKPAEFVVLQLSQKVNQPAQ